MKLWHLILGFSLIVSIVIASFVLKPWQSPTSDIQGLSSEILPTSFAYDQNLFLQGVSSATNSLSVDSQIVILPHHLLASPLIARGIKNISTTSKIVVILSPNHANTGNCDIATTSLSWSTPYGQTDVDTILQKKLLNTKEVCLDNGAFSNEHGVAGLLPFLKYYLPQVKVIPLIFKKNIELNKLKIVSDAISDSLKDKSIVVLCSLDFSHNLTNIESKKRDQETQKYIFGNDLNKINSLNSEYLDSPSVLITSLLLAQKNNLIFNILDHKNSTDFNNDPSLVTSYFLADFVPMSDDKNLTLLFGGDVMLGRSVNTQMIKKSDYSWPTSKIAEITKQADLFMVNLEGPFRSGCKPTDSGMVFCADPKSVATLTSAGVDVVNLANNHIYNQGKDGLSETTNILNKNNIKFTGTVQKTQIITIKNTKIVILGFNDIPPYPTEINKLSPENLKKQIQEYRSKVDLLIVTFHWGNEYQQASLAQKEYAHLAIDLGADAVIGAHPHWVQEYEEYQGKPIYYSLGNLVFDQMWSEETKKGLMVRLTYNDKKLVKKEDLPVKILDYGQPIL